jgi:DNA-binding response OmpR family regulator
MSRTVICSYCQLPQILEESQENPPPEALCENCGGPLPLDAPGTARFTTVLWIDDDRLLLSLCAPSLEREGYRMLLATDGATGIETAKKERVDAILLDVVMPMMGGLEVCRRLRAEPGLHATPIILLTAMEDPGLGAMGRQAGATTTLRKPFGPEHLVRFLDNVLGRQGGPLGPRR